MKRITKWIIFLTLLAALAIPSTALAAGIQPSAPGDKVVLGGTYDLPSGSSLDGNLAIFGGTSTIAHNATVNGDVFQLGGTLTVDGTVTGNLSAVGGTVILNQHALVQGDLSTVGAALHRDPNSRVLGKVTDSAQGPLTINTPSTPITPLPVVNFKPLADTIWFFFRTLAMAALAMLLVLFLPTPVERIGEAVVREPVITGGMGLLTGLVAPVLLVLLAITIILIPVSLIAAVILILAGVVGWIAIGLQVGMRIAELFKAQWPAALSAGVGTLVLSLVANGIGFIPCIGWIASAVIILLSLGAVLLTRFGSQPYPLPGGPSAPAPMSYPYPPQQPPAGPSQGNIPPGNEPTA